MRTEVIYVEGYRVLEETDEKALVERVTKFPLVYDDVYNFTTSEGVGKLPNYLILNKLNQKIEFSNEHLYAAKYVYSAFECNLEAWTPPEDPMRAFLEAQKTEDELEEEDSAPNEVTH